MEPTHITCYACSGTGSSKFKKCKHCSGTGEVDALTPSIPPSSKANTVNPKDLVGDTKVSFSKLPMVAVAHGAHAMMDGAKKYGAFNWRAKRVKASIYVDAAMRHLTAWFEGEETALDSQVHHLGHAIACCAILLDAQETGNLVDDRPVTDTSRATLSRVMARLQGIIKDRAAKEAAKP